MPTIQEKECAIAEMLGDEYIAKTDSWIYKDFRSYRSWRTSELSYSKDANWQYEAIDWIEKQGMYCRLISTKEGARFQTMTNTKPATLITDTEGISKKEAVFEALYQFSQYLKQ